MDSVPRQRQDDITNCVCVLPHHSGGSQSVRAQHRTYFNSLKKDRIPIAAFWEDLTAQVLSWHAQGDQVILGGDWNHDAKCLAMQDWFAKMGLCEVLLE